MTETHDVCGFCEQSSIGTDRGKYGDHTNCWNEFDRRRRDGICTFCGEPMPDNSREEKHDDCPYDYVGYPGP